MHHSHAFQADKLAQCANQACATLLSCCVHCSIEFVLIDIREHGLDIAQGRINAAALTNVKLIHGRVSDHSTSVVILIT
jgi:hypothetical protein